MLDKYSKLMKKAEKPEGQPECYGSGTEENITKAEGALQLFNDSKSGTEDDEPEIDFYIRLAYWEKFFEEEGEFCYSFLDADSEITEKATLLQENGIVYLQENQERILHNMLGELFKIYPELQKAYDYADDYKNDCMPDVKTIKGFSRLLSPTVFYVTSVVKDGYPYIGFSFNCSWDHEHDLGFMMYKDRIVEIGDATLAFDIYTAENDARFN